MATVMPVLAASHAAVPSEFRPYTNVKPQTPFPLNVTMTLILEEVVVLIED